MAASVPILTLKCVFPTPGEPTNTMFLFSSMNLNVAKSKISFLFIDGWKSKSNSSNVLLNGKGAKITVEKDSTNVTITFEKATANATIQNIK